MQKISTFLWFDTQAEEAVDFYVSVFKDAKKGPVRYYGKWFPERGGTVLTASLSLLGQEFVALNAGPDFKFTPAISFLVPCETQAEIDHLWEKLSEGGSVMQCGWLTDKFGVTWQIVPKALDEMLNDHDAAKAERVMKAMMGMVKMDVEALRQARDRKD